MSFIRVLQALFITFQRCLRCQLRHFWPNLHTKTACRGRFAFPQNATLEQNLRFYVLRESHFTSRKTMPASFNCQRTVAPIIYCRSKRPRFKRGAAPVWSRPAKSANNKKPGVERRANPSFAWAALPRSLRRMYSKLDCGLSGARNQSHLCFQKARLGIRTAPEASGHHRLQGSIAKVRVSSSALALFSSQASVDFSSFCGKGGNPVQIL